MQQTQTKMEYRNLGSTSLKVSLISYGNWLNSNDPQSILKNKEIVKHAWDLGINYFDTAEGYGKGQAEIQLGVALKELIEEKKVPREDLVVATKIFFGASEKDFPNSRFCSRKHIIEGLRNSLKRLQMTYVDIVFAHRYDHLTPMEEQCRAFDWVVRKGWATYWGTSEWSGQQIVEAIGVCERLGLIKPVTEQPQYNMFVRDKFESEYERVFGVHHYGSTVWSPLLSGILTGKYNDSVEVEGRFKTLSDDMAVKNIFNRHFGSPQAREKTQSCLVAIGDIAKELGCSQAQLAMAWVLRNKDVSTAITGATSKEQLNDTVKAIDVYPKLTKEIEARFEKLLENKPASYLVFKTLSLAPTRRDISINQQ